MLHMDLMVVRMEQRVNQRVATQIVRRISESGSANADLAAHLGMSEATLLRRLTSRTSFTVAELAQTAEFLDCTLSDLIPTSEPAVKSA
ncbi:transcriptional repressor [Mycobacterium phage Sparky]|uniref:CRO protein n=1 Tax=Mycobacterium phage Sparky TaxID=1527493 RepID=A0A076G7B4_9CAUD|nr:transcriptional repressor [Mycobacterium phage Sparky]AII28192.1 CRO protein [Mycobacterium phage Sparky]